MVEPKMWKRKNPKRKRRKLKVPVVTGAVVMIAGGI
jgi:hypothetical protein